MNDQVHPTLRAVLAGFYNTIQESIGSPLRMSEVEPESEVKEVFDEMSFDYEMRITIDKEAE